MTGGLGFIGSCLAKKLSREYRVLNIDKISQVSQKKLHIKKNYIFKKIDICNLKSLKTVFNSFNPDFVINCAAESHVDRSITSPKSFINSNILGTFNILECVKDATKKIRLLQISTDEVFGSLKISDKKFSEKTSYLPQSPYSASKASADHLVRAYGNTFGIDYLITNCSNNYGPFQFPEKLIPVIILSCIKKQKIPIYGKGKNVRDWIFVEDHCDAVIRVLKKSKSKKTYLIGSNNEKTNLEIAYKICDIFQKKIDKNFDYRKLINFVEDRKGHDFRYAINFSKIQKDLNWRPKYNFNEGIYKTIDFYIKNFQNLKKIFE